MSKYEPSVYCRPWTVRSATMGIIAGLFLWLATAAHADAELLHVKRIWDRAPHNAFTDLIRFQGQWFCVFREAQTHVSPAGKVRVITSRDGDTWTSAALLSRADSDLRDPKLNVLPDGRLMILAAASWHAPDALVRRQPMAWFSPDGNSWTAGVEVGEPNFWLWRVTWHQAVARGVGYGQTDGMRQTRLYESADGVTYKTLVSNLYDVGYPNETSILYRGDGTALCLLRRDGTPNTALLGTAKSPYTQWHWKDLGVRIGGPHFIELPGGRLVAATRLYDARTRTALSWLDPEAGTLEEFLTLPSGGDTSYPGLVFEGGLLWVSFYSSHESKTNIYLAQVRIPAAN